MSRSEDAVMVLSSSKPDWRAAFGEWWSRIGFDFCHGLNTQEASLAGWRARNAEVDTLRVENERLRATLERAGLLLRNAPGETARREAITEIETALGSHKDG